MKKIFITLVCIFAASSAFAATPAIISQPKPGWFCNSASGNDSNTGKSQSQALATIAAVEAKTPRAGQRIMLACGSEWREQLTIVANDVLVSTWGSGAKPILRADDVAPNANFSLSSGQTYTYQITVTATPASPVNSPVFNVWEDGSYLTLVTSIANCEATAGSYYPSAQYGNVTLYIHPTDNSDITTNGKTYEYTARANAINALAATRVILKGIVTKRNLETTGGIALGINSFAINCEANQGGKHNIYARSRSQLFNIIMTDAYWGGNGPVMFVAYDDVANGAAASCTNCVAQIVSAPATAKAGMAFFSHASTGEFTNFTLTDCSSLGMAYGFGAAAGNVAALNIINGTVTLANLTSASGVSVYVPTTIEGLTVNIDTAVSSSAVFIGGPNLTILANNLVENVTNAFTSRGVYSNQAGTNLTLANSTISKAGTPVFFDSGATGSTLISDHGSFSSIGNKMYILPADITLVSDYNNFHSFSYGVTIGGTTYNTMSLYEAATGQDAHSTN